MPRVTDVDDQNAPTVLIVDNNLMALHRLSGIFKQREFVVVQCEDGDKAVDEYIRLDPELVVMSLDIPSLDGHLAALEMREHGGDCRIIFTAPKHQAELAHDAAHSAGAIGWIEKPVSSSAFDAIWEKVKGIIPEAPGLDDLDEIHSDSGELKVEVEEDEGPLSITVLPPAAVFSEINVLEALSKSTIKKRLSKGKRLFIVFIVFAALGVGGWYAWKNNLLPI